MGETDVHVTEPPDKNEFLSDLDKMEEEEEGKEEEGEGEGDRRTAVEVAPRLYPDLESSVEVWSDFLRVHLHPKSLLMVPRHFHNEYVSEWRVLGHTSRVFPSCHLKQAARTNTTPPLTVVYLLPSPEGTFDTYPAGQQVWENQEVRAQV